MFGELSYKLTDKWTVIGGGRWFRYDRDINQHYQQPLGIPVGLGAPSGTSSGNESATLGKFSVQYRFNPDVMGYFLFSQGYRLGGYNSQRAVDSGAVPYQYQPDKLNNFELGMKSQWLDHRLTLNASLFLMKWTDIQLNSSTGAAGGAWWKRGTINGGSAENSGLELSGAARASKNWSINFSMTASNPHLTDPVAYTSGTTSLKARRWSARRTSRGRWVSGMHSTGSRRVATCGRDSTTATSRPYTRVSTMRRPLIRTPRMPCDHPGDPSYQIPANWGRIEPWRFAKFQVGVSLPSKLDVTLTLNNVFNSKGANWVTTGEGWYSGQFGDPRYKNMQAQFRPQSIGLTIRKDF